MHPSHQPTAGPITMRHGSVYLAPGLSVESLAEPAPVPAMDRKDQIFVDLLRLRRYSVRLKWWQFTQRRRIDARIRDLLTEQTTLCELDAIVRNHKAEQ